MDSQDGLQIKAALAQRVGKDADIAQVTDAIAAIWQEIDTALRPIIGQRGVAALHKRSAHLTSAAHPWMVHTPDGLQTSLDFAALRAMFAQQTGAEAAAGGAALLQTFHELLASLVGPSLTERLLRSVWAYSSSGTPAQDSSP